MLPGKFARHVTAILRLLMRILFSNRTHLPTSRLIYLHILCVRRLALLIRLGLHRRMVISRLGPALGAETCITSRTLANTGTKSATIATLSGTKQMSAIRQPETVLPSLSQIFVRRQTQVLLRCLLIYSQCIITINIKFDGMLRTP